MPILGRDDRLVAKLTSAVEKLDVSFASDHRYAGAGGDRHGLQGTGPYDGEEDRTSGADH